MVSFYQFGVTQKSKFLYIFYASMALGVLTKGLVVIVFAIAIIFVYAICTKQIKLIWKLFHTYWHWYFFNNLCTLVLSCL